MINAFIFSLIVGCNVCRLKASFKTFVIVSISIQFIPDLNACFTITINGFAKELWLGINIIKKIAKFVNM
jgi:hypothetical protein